jgi:prophage DNA circulation protein
LAFDFEDVSRNFNKKTAAFEFPDANGTYVQDLGNTGRKYPLRLFFWGDDYDLAAEAFESALQETGEGKLEHPIYGVVTVVPFGAVKRRDDLKNAANQAIIDVTFWETTGVIYPTPQADPGSSVLTAVTEYNNAAATEFEEVTDLDSAVEQATFKNDYQALLNQTSSTLQSIADEQDDVRQQFDAIVDSVNTGIDILVEDPLTLAFQTTLLIEAPARALTAIEARLDAYAALANAIISGDGAVIEPGLDSRAVNTFRTNDLYASTYVAGSIVSVVNNEFLTRGDALAAARS